MPTRFSQSAIHLTINLSPSLLWQIEDYVERGATDRALELTLQPADELTEDEREEILSSFFDADWHNQIFPHPRYKELFLQRVEGRPFSTQDLRDLQAWFNLAWFGKEFRDGEVELERGNRISIHRFVEQRRGFSAADVRDIVAAQYAIMRAVIPIHRAMQDRGQIEISTTPFYHPILPLIIDTDRATIDRPGAGHPTRFNHPEDADAHVRRAVEFYERRLGRSPAGMWPAEGAVSQFVVQIFARHGLAWIATDGGVLARSGRWGYEAHDPDVLCQPYRVEDQESSIVVFFRDGELSDAIGFRYHGYEDPQQAAFEFVKHIKERDMARIRGDADRVLTIRMSLSDTCTDDARVQRRHSVTATVLARSRKTTERIRKHAAGAATVSLRTLRLRLRRELEALDVQPDHYLRRPLPEPGMRAMVYFLSLRPLELPGYDRMLRELLTKAIYSSSTNKGYLAWVSALAEIKAIWLLFKLGLEIQGIEQASPRRRSAKTCDIVASYPGGPPIYFEVKLRATEDVQWIPDEVFDALAKLKYPATPQLVRHRTKPPAFDSSVDLPPILAAIEEHIARYERDKALGLVAGREEPRPLRRPGLDIELIFRSDHKHSPYKMRYVDPPWPSDIERWLFDREATGRDGKAMVPMVDAAAEKGADYLIAEGPSFSPPCAIALHCFDCAEEWSGRELLVKDPRIGALRGIILFKGSEWLLIGNADRSQRLRLEHVTESPALRHFP